MDKLNREFWQAAHERAIKTGLQFLIPLIPLVFGTTSDLLGTAWADLGVGVAGGVLLSYATSVVSALGDGNPSVGAREVTVGHTPPVADDRLAQ